MTGSPERLYLTEPFNFGDENVIKHVSRYTFASQFAHGEIIDCACGSGYGSKILENCGNVLGVDRSREAIEFAEHYNPGPMYAKLDVCNLKTKAKFDSVVCIETFEHIPPGNSYEILVKFDSLLKKDGLLFLTTPMLRFREGKPYVTNPYHVNEMERDKLHYLFDYVFENYTKTFFHQDINHFTPLKDENTGFMVMVARKH